MMSEEQKRQIAEVLSQRVGTIVCPICHQRNFTLLDGYFVSVVQNGYKDIEIGGRVLPTISIVCNNCGHLENFSLGVLGLIGVEKVEWKERKEGTIANE